MRFPLQGGDQTSHVAQTIIFYALLQKTSICILFFILRIVRNFKIITQLKKIRKCEVLLCNETCWCL